MPIKCEWNGRFPDGKPGKSAAKIKTKPPVGKAGANGAVETGAPQEHNLALSLRGLRLLAIEAERRHLLGSNEGSAALASWLFSISAQSENAEIQEVRARAAATLGRLESGSPPAGVTGLHAPIVALDRHLEVMESMLESQFRAEAYLDNLRADVDSAAQTTKTLSWARGEASRIAGEADTRLDEIADLRAEVVDRLDELTETWPELWRQVMDADQEFQDAVARKAGDNCEFLDAAISVASIVTSVASGGAAVFGAVASGAKFVEQISADAGTAQKYGEVIDWAGERKTSLEGVAKGAKDLRNTAQSLKEQIGGDSLTPPSDHVRLSMSREDFNDMIEPYLELTEAQELQELMDKFFTLVETRNSLLVEHDQLVVEAAELRARAAAARQRINEILAHEAGNLLLDATDVYETAMWTELELRKRFLAVVLEANAAFEHQALRTRRLELGSSRAEELEAEYRRLYQDALELEGQTPEIPSIRRLRVTRDSHPEVFAQLASSGTATITLTPPIALLKWDERADAVGIEVTPCKGEKLQLDTAGHLVSSGLSILVDNRGRRVVSRIPRRPANPQITTDLDPDDVNDSRNLSGSGKAVSVSPYGVWQLRAPELTTSLDQIAELTFMFTGTARLTSALSRELRRVHAAREGKSIRAIEGVETALSPETLGEYSERMSEALLIEQVESIRTTHDEVTAA